MNENRVVDLMSKWLSGNGYRIKSSAHYNERGDDILAISGNGASFHIECKGSEPNEGGERVQ